MQNPHRCLVTTIKRTTTGEVTDMFRSAYTIIPGGYFTPNMFDTNNFTYFVITPLLKSNCNVIP